MLLIVISCCNSACKKAKPAGAQRVFQESTDTPLATAFVAKSPIPVYDNADFKSKVVFTLPLGAEVAVFAKRVPDKKQPEQLFWYKIRYAPMSADVARSTMPIEGFVSEREEVLRNNLMVFEHVPSGRAAIAITAVNFRASPVLNAQVLRTLKNGEVLSVLEESAKTYPIDNKTGYWYKLRSQNGEQGYAFGGFLVVGPEEDIKSLEAIGFQFQSGWVTPNSKKVIVHTGPIGNSPIDFKEAPHYLPAAWSSNNGTLEEGVYVRVDGVATEGEPQRYRVVVEYQDYDISGKSYFYVDKKAVKFVKDYYTLSKKLPHDFDDEMADRVNKYLGGDLNVQCSSEQEYSSGSDDRARRFKVITAALGAPQSGTGREEQCSSTGKVSVIAELINGKWILTKTSSGEFKDLDGDNIPELVSVGGGRGYYTLEIYSIKPGKAVLLAALAYDEDGRSPFGHFMVSDQGYLEIEPPMECRRSEPDEYSKKQCEASIAKIRQTAKFLKFDPSLAPFPFRGKLEGEKFVQVGG